MRFKSIIAFALASLVVSSAWAGSPQGRWVTIDDKTKTKRAVIAINESNNTLTATIVQVFPQPGDAKICTKCPGKLKNKPFIGLTFAWGLVKKGNDGWADGQILDPHTGKIYKAKMTLKGDKLYVRGFIGLSLIGRTQIWTRA